MANEVLTIAQSYQADRHAADHGVSSLTLMENAGRAVADRVISRFPEGSVIVFCGPGNNGGDGLVAARLLAQRGRKVRVSLLAERYTLTGDAAVMASRWSDDLVSPTPDLLTDAGVIVDAMFGAGLSRPLHGPAEEVVNRLNRSGLPVVAVDVPSGLHGDFGHGFDQNVVKATHTVTFFRKKPAHVLAKGISFCGKVSVAQIGIPDSAIAEIRPAIFENGPALWGREFPWPQALAHKYARGHCVIVSGNGHATGAARLAARGALRIGAGLVTVASPPDAVAVNAAQLSAIMVKPFEGAADLAEVLSDKRLNAVVIGPGCGVGASTRELVRAALTARCVLDADALTSFQDNPDHLFQMLRPENVITPHEGEFERILPGLLAASENRMEAARKAAALAGCVVVLKGPDTVIASPDGRAIVNTSAPATLATAGSGDVLAGFIGGLLAQRMDPFPAAAAAVWLHGSAASAFGPGLISEDLPELLPEALSMLREEIDGGDSPG